MNIADRSRQVRGAQNQSLFREVNERIGELSDRFGPGRLAGWVCECADEACTRRLELSVQEYEAIRADGNRFPVLAGHEKLDIERVVERHDQYVVVEKLGEGAVVAREIDARSRS